MFEYCLVQVYYQEELMLNIYIVLEYCLVLIFINKRNKMKINFTHSNFINTYSSHCHKCSTGLHQGVLGGGGGWYPSCRI